MWQNSWGGGDYVYVHKFGGGGGGYCPYPLSLYCIDNLTIKG